MPTTGATYIDIPFGTDGTVTQVPDGVQGDGSVSFTQGYGANYELAQDAPGSLNVELAKMNYMFFLLTTIAQQWQQFTTAPWITHAENGGSPFSYAQYAQVLYTDGHIYESLMANNTTDPVNDGIHWQIVDASAISSITFNQVIITSSGTYNPSDGLLFANVRLVGGGGGGGGLGASASSSAAAGGGGYAGYAEGTFSATAIGASKAVTIGGGGAAGSTSGGTGGAGGTTSFGTLLVAGGGSGGVGTNVNSPPEVCNGGAGGNSSAGPIQKSGQAGGVGFGISVGSPITVAGAGGSGDFGAGGQSLASASAVGAGPGLPGAGNGSGGSGAQGTASQLGGAGAPGIVIIMEYIK